MTITIEVTPQELGALRQLTKLEDDAEAIMQAAREYVRISKLRELKAVCGKVDYEPKWQELDELELNEIGFPQ